MQHPLRILIADDDRHARAGLRAFLSTALDCQIVGEATNGTEAIAQSALYQPDVVLLDLRMPVLDGVAAIRIIKAGWPKIVIVALTLYAEQRDAALAAGADAFVAKGDAPTAIAEALRAVPSREDGDVVTKAVAACVLPASDPENIVAG